MIRKGSLLVLFLALSVPFAHADEASKRAKLKELFTVMKLDRLMEQVMHSSAKQSEEMMKGMFGGQTISPVDQKIIDSFEMKMTALVEGALAWKKIEPAYVDLYASTYSEADVDGILTFYKSPAGMAMVAKTPELVAASQKIVLARMTDLQPQLRDMMQDLQGQIKAAHKADAPLE